MFPPTISRYILFFIFLSLACSNQSYQKMPKKPAINKISFDLQGHRGARGVYPENSIPGFLYALEQGVTTLELDICVSKDSQLIISHEPWFSYEICLDSNGEPISELIEKQHKLYALTAEEIKTYDCGSKPHPRFPDQKKMKVYKPTLGEMVEAVEQKIQEAGLTPVYYNIETKSTPEGDGVLHPDPITFTKLLYNELKELGILKRSIVQSFDERTLQAMRNMDSTVTLALLVENEDGIEKNLAKLGFLPDIYSPDHTLVDETLVKSCHEKNIKLIPWTVNDLEEMKQLRQLGVDGLITDFPNKAKFLIQP